MGYESFQSNNQLASSLIVSYVFLHCVQRKAENKIKVVVCSPCQLFTHYSKSPFVLLIIL